MQLTSQFHCPREGDEPLDRLNNLVETHSKRILAAEYWNDEHLAGIQEHSGQSYTYVRDNDEYDPFENVESYVYNRAKRCIYAQVAHVLDAHADEYDAFEFVTSTVEERKIRRIGWRRIRNALYDDESPYVNWSTIETVIEKLNKHFDEHGRFPDAYTDLVDCPQPNGTIGFAPDKGDYHLHDLELDEDDLVVTINTPDSDTPESHHDWTRHEFSLPTHERFRDMVEAGSLGAPTLHKEEHGFVLDVPVDVPELDCEASGNRVLAVDLGVKKQATAVPVERGDEEHERGAPVFVDHHAKDKLFRLKSDADGINDRVQNLRRDGKAHTDRFSHLLSEYRNTRARERRLREQIQHDVANQLVWIALQLDCSTIVFESLGALESGDVAGKTAWSVSSWARGELLDNVEYKAGLVGVEFETVPPWGTSRYCPECGERGRTVKAPNDHTEVRHGGHFHCQECDYECDRDVVGAVNVGRKFLSECKMEAAKPSAYTAVGDHASFPSHVECDRSTVGAETSKTASVSGVQSVTNQQDSVSGRQNRRSRNGDAAGESVENDMVGLLQSQRSDNAQPWATGSVVECALTRTTEHFRLLPITTEN